jgi:hypothetical protein
VRPAEKRLQSVPEALKEAGAPFHQPVQALRAPRREGSIEDIVLDAITLVFAKQSNRSYSSTFLGRY